MLGVAPVFFFFFNTQQMSLEYLPFSFLLCFLVEWKWNWLYWVFFYLNTVLRTHRSYNILWLLLLLLTKKKRKVLLFFMPRLYSTHQGFICWRWRFAEGANCAFLLITSVEFFFLRLNCGYSNFFFALAQHAAFNTRKVKRRQPSDGHLWIRGCFTQDFFFFFL